MAALEHVGILRRVLAFPVDRDCLQCPCGGNSQNQTSCMNITTGTSSSSGDAALISNGGSASTSTLASTKCTGTETVLAAAFRLEVPPADVLSTVIAAGGAVVYK